MIRNILPFLFALSVLSTLSCQKEDVYSIKGRVLNGGSGEPIEQVCLILYGNNSSQIPFLSEIKDENYGGNIDTTYSDENGYFELSIKAESGFAPYIKATKEGYFDFKQEGNTMWGYANCWFLPTFVRNRNASDNDSVRLYVTTKYFTPKNSTISFKKNPIVEHIGKSPFSIDPLEELYCYGDSYIYYKLECSNNDSCWVMIDSVFLSSFETYTDTIYY
ncbi:MAG: hypothetical protein MJ198_09230 [Bacteroidales bacterium]|nr:hypothetical protein [Bacteroidales bacterium]